MKKFKLILIFGIIFNFNQVFSQILPEYTHPELDWYTIQTEHFKVHYHNGAERTARIVAKIAEDIYAPVTTMYDWEPDGIVHFIIKDYEDNSNGGAFYYDNKVEIWAPQMTFILRGTNDWLRNVVTHEFSHMISLGAARKLPRKIPAFYMQMIGYEEEKRPDVLYGYPNIIASYPLPMTVIPMWLAEGMAQFQVPGLDYDRWDSHRDMLMRTAVLNKELHSFTEMGVFGKNSLGNERTYNSGYAFVRYIAHNYGAESIPAFSKELSKFFHFGINGALKNVTGFSGTELYGQWCKQITEYYTKRVEKIREHEISGENITPKGIGNVYPKWSPDGKTLAFCGSESQQYLSFTNLKLYNLEKKKFDKIKIGVNSQLAWDAKGNQLYYVKRKENKNHSNFFDLYKYDLTGKKEKKLTSSLRSVDPDWSAELRQFVCVVQKDGTDNLVVLDENGDKVKNLTNYKNSQGVYSPRWSKDGQFIVFSQSRKHGRDIKKINVETGEIFNLINDQNDARDPVISPDGKRIYFSWDRTGIFNIYSMDMNGQDIKLWTNVTGGAFMPDVSVDGTLAYSNFKHDGYKVNILENPVEIDQRLAEYVNASDIAPELQNIKLAELPENLKSVTNYNDFTTPSYDTTKYGMEYSQVSFYPRVMVDSNQVKLGSYFFMGDILDKYNVFGGAAVNSRKDIDVFTSFRYNKLGPSLFLELYGFTRNIEQSIEVIENYKKAPVDIRFSILEAYLGSDFYINKSNGLKISLSHHRSTSKIKDFFFQGVTWRSPSNTYFVGNHVSFQYTLDQLPGLPYPVTNRTAGRYLTFTYTREFNKFFEDFATDNEYNSPQEVYTDYNYNRFELEWREYLPVPWHHHHSFAMNLHAGVVDRSVDSFFNFFAGGMPGLRGYPFYSIEGRKMLVGRFTYRFPIFDQMQKSFLQFTTDKLYLGAFFDYGNAFDKDFSFSDFKKDAGLSLRFSAFSFFGMPTAFQFESAYGFDKVTNEGQIYGEEWRHYVTLLFDFID